MDPFAAFATLEAVNDVPAVPVVRNRSQHIALMAVSGHPPKLPPELRGYEWHAVGRLDRDTTGLLLFTNEERLGVHATAPRTHLPKRYEVQVAVSPSEGALRRLREGVELEEGLTRPAEARLRGPGVVELVLTEGRHHQVKRMLEAVGHPVLGLHREAMGTVTLDVPEGSWRLLTEDEVTRGLGFQDEPRAN